MDLKCFKYEGRNFVILTDYPVYHFFIYKYPPTDGDSDKYTTCLLDLLDYILDWSDLYLEDCLQLMKLKEEING